MVGVCLSPNCIDTAGASQVGALRSVLNASSGFSLALSAMASNGSQLASGFSLGGTPFCVSC